ncbi:MAG: hypothetical protein ACK4XK_05750 [Casimicrobiaceae bacterium]
MSRIATKERERGHEGEQRTPQRVAARLRAFFTHPPDDQSDSLLYVQVFHPLTSFRSLERETAFNKLLPLTYNVCSL